MADGETSLLLKILGDSTGAQKALKDVQGTTVSAVGTIVSQLKAQGATADQTAQVMKQLGYSTREAATEIKSAYSDVASSAGSAEAAVRDVGETAQTSGQKASESVKTFAQSVRSSTADLTALRRAMYATFGFVSLGYMISEWQNMAKAIANAALSLGGYDSVLRQADADTQAWQSHAVEALGKFTAKQYETLMGIKDRAIRERQESRFRMEDAQAELNQMQQSNAALKAKITLIRQVRAEEQQAAEGTSGLFSPKAMLSAQQYFALILKAHREGLDTSSANLQKLQKEYDAAQLKQIDQARRLKDLRLQQLDADDKLQKSQATQESKAVDAEVRLMAAGLRQQELMNTMQKREAQLDQRLENSLTTAFRSTEAEFNKATNLGEKWLAWETAFQGKGVKVGAAGSETWLARQAKAAIPAFEKIAELQRDVVSMSPEALAAITKVYGQMSVSAMAALPGIKAVTQAWKDQGIQEDQALSGALSRLTQFETALPAASDAMTVAFATMSVTMQQFTLSSMQFTTAFTAALNQELKVTRDLGASLRAALADGIKAIAEYYAKQAEIHAAADVAWGIEALANLDFPAAASWFAAAAAWGALGAGLSAAGGVLGGALTRSRSSYGGGTGSGGYRTGGRGESYDREAGGGSAGSGGGQQLTPGGNLPEAPKNGNLTISIMGETEAGQWLANTLNTVVQQGGAQLTATHTTAIPNPTA